MHLDKILDAYLNSIKLDELSYSDLNTIKDKFYCNDISLYIPSWKFTNRRNIEFISFSHGLVIWGGEKHQKGLNSDGEYDFNFDHPLHLIRKIDRDLKIKLDFNPFFYIVLLSYESCNSIEQISKTKDFYQLPDFYLVFPGDSILIDHTQKKIYQYSIDSSVLTTFYLKNSDKHLSKISEKKSKYISKISDIRELIYQGEVYQINYTIRFSEKINIPGVQFFQKLYNLNPSPFSFYANFPHCEILSNSPERFIYLDKGKITAQPIKGTINRSQNPALDKELRQKLKTSDKDGAELSMIVDLLRNDISRVCKPGSVKVISHKTIKSFQNVHHLQSTITGKLENKKDFIDILKASFPGGSITGCPKIAAMKYISQFENHNRSFYTGTCFIRFPCDNTFDSNILIRTIIKKGDWYHFQAGGGIVIDSKPEAEYQECLMKASSFHNICRNFNG